MVDPAHDPHLAQVLADCARRLREFCDPEEVDARAKSDQALPVEQIGGLEAASKVQVPLYALPREPRS